MPTYSLFQNGRTSFHAACSEGHYDVVKVLVKLKASQSSQDKVCISKNNIAGRRDCSAKNEKR